MRKSKEIDVEVSNIQLQVQPEHPKMKKVESEIIDLPEIQQEQEHHIQISKYEQKLKASSRLRSVIRSKISGLKQNRQEQLLASMVNSLTGPIKRSITKKFQCQICFEQSQEKSQLYVASCIHQHNYCESCIHQYTIYIVSQFQEVVCPNEECNKPLDTDGKFFKQLPLDIQDKYKKIHNFHLAFSDSNIKMCPQEDCDGLIKKIQNQNQLNNMQCSKCNGTFCGKCLMRAHGGQCDDNQIDFLVHNLKYKRCRKCQMIIQKNQGCNHMTCKCTHQFCYVCGQDWDPIHYNQHDQTGRPIVAENSNHNQQNQECGVCCCIVAFIRLILFMTIKIPLVIILVFLMLIFLVILAFVLPFFVICDRTDSFGECFRSGVNSFGECIGFICQV